MKYVSGLIGRPFLFFVFFFTLLHTGQSEAQTVKGPKLTLYTHYQFRSLSEKKRIKYIKTIREVMKELEVQQNKSGFFFDEARMILPEWLQLGIQTADADEPGDEDGQAAPSTSATCIYAGNFSTYSTRGKRVCQNNFKCDGGKPGIKCQDMLYGDQCISAGEGATARCERALKNSKITDAELAKAIASPEGRKRWEAFKAEFDAFCPGIYQSGRNNNISSCRRVEGRMNAIQKELDLIPLQAQELTSAGSRATSAPSEVRQGVCGESQQSGSCMNCPDNLQMSEIEGPGFGTQAPGSIMSRAGQLAKIMAISCGVENTSDKEDVGARTEGDMARILGSCTNADLNSGMSWEDKYISSKSKQLIVPLQQGDQAAIQEMSRGLWSNARSQALLDHYGLDIREARQIFCTNIPMEKKMQILKSHQAHDFNSGEGAIRPQPREVEALIKNSSELKTAPQGFEGVTDMYALNRFKVQYMRRSKLAACVQKGGSLSDLSGRRIEMRASTQKCNLETYNATAADIPGTLLTLSDRGLAPVCITYASGKTGRCDGCRKNESGQMACSCDKNLENESAKMTVLNCGPLDADARCNRPSRDRPEGDSDCNKPYLPERRGGQPAQ